MTSITGIDRPRPRQDASFEQVSIPPDRSFLWRRDDYPNRRSIWNFHPEVEIHLIRHSSGLSYVGDHIGAFAPGDLCLVGSNLPHNWVTLDTDGGRLSGRDIVVQFDPAVLLKGCAAFREMDAVSDLLERGRLGLRFNGETARAGGNLMEAMDHQSHGQGVAMFLNLVQMLAVSKEYQTLATLPFVQSMRNAGPEQLDRLQRALIFIQERFVERPSLAEAAEFSGMSETAFSRFFKRRTGNTFTEHLVALRISAAQRLLGNTSEAITHICYHAGFNNISNFNRVFLRKVGMSPSAYRRAVRMRA